MTTVRRKISVILVLTLAIICFAVPFITELTNVRIFNRKTNSIFKSQIYIEANVVTYDITLSSDGKVFPLFPTLLNSIHSNLLEGEFANIHIITMPDVTITDHSVLLGLMEKLGFLKKLRIIFYPFTFEIKYKQTLKHVSQATMCRLLIPKILDQGVHKLLYIDTDVIVNSPLRRLFDIEIKSECGIVARSSTNNNLINEWLKKDGLSNDIHYYGKKSFNAGVLLIDLEKLRKNNFVEKTLDIVQRWGINDQIALNLYCNGGYDELPLDYNYWAGRDDVKDIDKHKIVHFVGPNKPWRINYQPYEEQLLWYNYSLSYPEGNKMNPPIKPTYVLWIKYNANLDIEDKTEPYNNVINDIIIPDTVINTRLCRYMINIVAINYKKKDRVEMEKVIKEYSKKIWLEYKFININIDSNNNIDDLISEYILVRAPQLFGEYVNETYISINNVPESGYICQANDGLEYNNILDNADKENKTVYDKDNNYGEIIDGLEKACFRIKDEFYKINLVKLRENNEYIKNYIENNKKSSILFNRICV